MPAVYKRYTRTKSRWVGETIDVDAEEALHQVCSKHLRQSQERRGVLRTTDLTAFVADEDFVVHYWATTFVDDPDNEPFYSIRCIAPTPMDVVKSWTWDQLSDATTDIVGNFEP